MLVDIQQLVRTLPWRLQQRVAASIRSVLIETRRRCLHLPWRGCLLLSNPVRLVDELGEGHASDEACLLGKVVHIVVL